MSQFRIILSCLLIATPFLSPLALAEAQFSSGTAVDLREGRAQAGAAPQSKPTVQTNPAPQSKPASQVSYLKVKRKEGAFIFDRCIGETCTHLGKLDELALELVAQKLKSATPLTSEDYAVMTFSGVAVGTVVTAIGGWGASQLGKRMLLSVFVLSSVAGAAYLYLDLDGRSRQHLAEALSAVNIEILNRMADGEAYSFIIPEMYSDILDEAAKELRICRKE